jgi:glycosyltransferase involved in cell wall biosynthesis
MGGSATSTVPETLVVPLAGGVAHATDLVRRFVDSGAVDVFALTGFGDGRRRIFRDRRYRRLALVGAPPDAEIGYAFSLAIALLARPRQVAVVDFERAQVRVDSLPRFIAHSAPFAVAQVAASIGALVVQRAAVAVAGGLQARRGRRQDLAKLVYLRPVIGSESGVGGSITHVHEVVRALRAEGIAVDAFTTGAAIAAAAAREPEPPCHWHCVATPRVVKAIPASAAAGGDAALIGAAWSAALDADVIYQRHARFSLVGAVLARLTGRPFFLEYNGSEQFVGRHWNKTPLAKRLAACENAAVGAADRIFVVSDVDRRNLLQRGVEGDRIVVNPNGVDARRFALGGGAEIRSRYGIAPSDLVIGFVGSFGPWHGAPVLARAFAAIAERVPHAHLLLVGDGPELEATRAILRDAGLLERTTLAGEVPFVDVPPHLDACDVLASPHVPLPEDIEFFGSPTKLFEYMAADKAIIASRLGQIGEVLEHGVTAWLTEPGDVSDLAEGLAALAERPELRRELGANARREAIQRHSWQQNSRRVIEAYSSLAAGAR